MNSIRFVNPFVPVIRFTVGTGLKITCSHERRHVLQASRVKQSPGFPRHSTGGEDQRVSHLANESQAAVLPKRIESGCQTPKKTNPHP